MIIVGLYVTRIFAGDFERVTILDVCKNYVFASSVGNNVLDTELLS